MKAQKMNSMMMGLVAFGLLLTACEKEVDSSEEGMTEEDAVEVMAKTADPDGYTDHVVYLAEQAEMLAESGSCGLNWDTLIHKKSDPGARTDYDYSFSWEAELLCNRGFRPVWRGLMRL